jgi:peptide/nickel transport system substrate-binding protein
MRTTVTILAAAVAAAALASEAAAQKRDLVVATSAADAGTLDPHSASAGPDKTLVSWMFNGLVRLRPGQASPSAIEPDLAESWTADEAGKVWTFAIREGVQCHGGHGAFTAEDAAYSLQRAADKDRSAFAADFGALESVEALDPRTLKITLKTPIPSLLGLVSNYHGGQMVCKAAVEAMGQDFARHPIGTGPFMFAEYQPQQYVRLVANTDYWRGAPALDSVTYRYIESDATRDLALQTGEVDMIFGRQAAQWVERMRAIPDVEVVAMEPSELNQIHLNMAMKPLDDLRVRQAIAYAIDRQGFVQLTGPDVARAAVSVILAGNVGINDDPGLLPHDLTKAKALLAEAGHADGITLKAVQSTLPSLMRIMETVQAQLGAAGIRLEIEPVDHPTYHATIRKDLSAVTLYQAARFPVADVYLTQFFHSRSTVATPTAVTNFSHCAVADAQIDGAKAEPDPARREQLWRDAQAAIVDAVCAVPLSEQLVMWAWRNTLDFGIEMTGSLNLGPLLTETTRFTQ